MCVYGAGVQSLSAKVKNLKFPQRIQHHYHHHFHLTGENTEEVGQKTRKTIQVGELNAPRKRCMHGARGTKQGRPQDLLGVENKKVNKNIQTSLPPSVYINEY